MNKTERAELLRSLHHAKAGGMAYKPSGKPLRPNTAPIEGPGFGVWGKGGLRFKPYVPPAEPERTKAIVPRPNRRRAGDAALTRIARQLPKKLPRVLFDL